MSLLRYQLERFGLTERQAVALGDVPVLLRATIAWEPYARVYRYPPDERIARLDAMAEPLIGIVLSNWPGDVLPLPSSDGGVSRFLYGSMPARLLRRLTDLPIAHVSILRIGRRRPRRQTQDPMKFFGVKARYAVQIEGQRRGRQAWEERVLLVRARSHEDACDKIRVEAKIYGVPGLNPQGYRYRFQLESVLESYDTMESRIESDVFEVWSTSGERAMPRRGAWLP